MRRETVWFLSVLNTDLYTGPRVREDQWGPNLWSTGYSFRSTAGQLRWQSEPLKASEVGKTCKNRSP